MLQFHTKYINLNVCWFNHGRPKGGKGVALDFGHIVSTQQKLQLFNVKLHVPPLVPFDWKILNKRDTILNMSRHIQTGFVWYII